MVESIIVISLQRYKIYTNLNLIEVAFDSLQFWEVVRLREIVLRLPLNMRFSADQIIAEKDEIIYALQNEHGRIIATNQFVIHGTEAKMRQVATSSKFQGKGYGKKLYELSEAKLKAMGIFVISCHARSSAIPFYEKQGFVMDSAAFLEVGIPHRKMKKFF
jgi:predicted GNAT family N-acyltransferase